LTRLIQSANTHVYQMGRDASPGGVAMATTLVACSFRYDRAAVAHVGDSRCYLVRRGEAMILTRDHTVVNDQMRLGLLSAREAAEASTRHLLSRSIGNNLFVAVDTSDHQIFSGDVLVLCSDGLHGCVERSEIAALTGNGGDLNKAAQKLVALANQRDGGDNITVQIIRVLGVERMGMYRGRPYKLR
jgi:serine/threonine protein phosphatase PrpC